MGDLLLIKKSSVDALADRVRSMAGHNLKMTWEDILWWLGKVEYIPRYHAFTEVENVKISTKAEGVLL